MLRQVKNKFDWKCEIVFEKEENFILTIYNPLNLYFFLKFLFKSPIVSLSRPFLIVFTL